MAEDAPKEIWVFKCKPRNPAKPSNQYLGEGVLWARTKDEADRIVANYSPAGSEPADLVDLVPVQVR